MINVAQAISQSWDSSKITICVTKAPNSLVPICVCHCGREASEVCVLYSQPREEPAEKHHLGSGFWLMNQTSNLVLD